MSRASTISRGRRRLALALVSWFVAMGAVYYGLDRSRRWALDELAAPDSQKAWQAWQSQEQTRAEDQSASVQRRPPKANEPPLLILLRDYFPATAISVLLIASFLFGFFAVIVPGAFRARGRPAGNADRTGPE